MTKQMKKQLQDSIRIFVQSRQLNISQAQVME